MPTFWGKQYIFECQTKLTFIGAYFKLEENFSLIIMYWKTLNKVCLKQNLLNGLNMAKLLHGIIEFKVTPQIAKLAPCPLHKRQIFE